MSKSQNRSVVEMRGVSVGALRDPAFTVLAEVNWTVATGEFWVVAGQEHSGKSDLLMLAAGLMPPQAGQCELFGIATRNFGDAEQPERARVGFVFDGGQLFNQLTIAENVALPLRYQKNLTAADAARPVAALLDSLELAPLADLTPPNITANWRLRAALARALILRPELLLLDNPLTGLGARHLQWWRRFLNQLWRGQALGDGQPLTIIVTVDDLSRLAGWDNTRRKFALLRDKKFIPLGEWDDVKSSDDPIVKELLNEAVENVEPLNR